MKLTLKEVNEAWDVITKVLDSIENFSRKWELAQPYGELKEKGLDFLQAERQKIVEKYVDKQTGKIPQKNQQKADAAFAKLLNTEVETDVPLKFKSTEVEQSGITGSELSRIFKFIRE